MTLTEPTTPARAPGRPDPSPASGLTRSLLLAGAVAGPLFLTTVLVQAVLRTGFDPSRHPLSLLSLGPHGWVQITNFVLSGLLASAGAVGLHRRLRGQPAGTWGPRLIAAYGVAMIWGGIFLVDPADGFPVGAADPAHVTWHGTLHNLSPTLGGLALDAACLVFARRFLVLGLHRWAAYSLIALVVDIGTAAAAGITGDFRWLYAGGATIWIWASLLAVHVLHDGGRPGVP